MQFEKRQVIIFLFAICSTFGILAVFFILLILKNIRKNAERKLELYKSAIKTQESERNRIGRNLHDELGALLALVRLNIDSMAHFENLSEVRSMAQQAKQQLDDALREVRKIVNDLVPRNIDKYGLIEALDELTKAANRNGAMEIIFRHSNVPGKRLPLNAEINLYRVVQELMNNSIKHSGGSKINISVWFLAAQLKIVFSDNGKGFDYTNRSAGLGIDNLITRVELYKGDLKIDSRIGFGTEYVLIFALENLQ